MADLRFRNWQNAVDIDYLSLYIKTWFAFLSTVQELHPEAVDRNGDGSLLNVYKEHVGMPTNFRDVMISHIEKVFKIGYTTIKRDVPQSYFVNFYKIDNSFRIDLENQLSTYQTIGESRIYDKSTLKIEYKDILDHARNPNILLTMKSSGRKFNNNLGVYHICFNIQLSDFIDQNDENGNRIFKSKDSCLNVIEFRIQQKLFAVVDSIENLEVEEVEERRGYCNGLIRPLVTLLRQSFEVENLFPSLPLKDFALDYNVEGNQIKILNWFIMFNYQIRNLLFHSIIDPFDSAWLKLFKHAYLSLKELVEHNIDQIENRNLNQ